MNVAILLKIIEIGLSFLRGEVGLGNKMSLAEAALQIYGASRRLYEAEVGQPIDESKVPAWEDIP